MSPFCLLEDADDTFREEELDKVRAEQRFCCCQGYTYLKRSEDEHHIYYKCEGGAHVCVVTKKPKPPKKKPKPKLVLTTSGEMVVASEAKSISDFE